MDLAEIGALLRETRTSKKLKVKAAAKDLKIREQYIEAMESGDLTAISTHIYPIGYLKSYAKWLGLDSEDLAAQLRHYKEQFKTGKPLSTETSSFSYRDAEAARPGWLGLVVATITVVIIYSAWYLLRPTLNPPAANETFARTPAHSPQEMDAVLSTLPATPATGKNVVRLDMSGRTGDIILMAREENWLDFKNTETGETSRKFLSTSDVFFLENPEKIEIVAEQPEAIDVFLEVNGQSTLLGTLKELEKTSTN